MREHAGLKDDGKIARGHQILVRLASKDCQEVEDVEEQILAGRRHARDEKAVRFDSALFVKVLLGADVPEKPTDYFSG